MAYFALPDGKDRQGNSQAQVCLKNKQQSICLTFHETVLTQLHLFSCVPGVLLRQERLPMTEASRVSCGYSCGKYTEVGKRQNRFIQSCILRSTDPQHVWLCLKRSDWKELGVLGLTERTCLDTGTKEGKSKF